MKLPILGTGLSGLVGSRVVELLSSTYTFSDIKNNLGANIINKKAVISAVGKSNAKWIVHFAAKTDVDACEEDKKEDIKILGYKDIRSVSNNTKYNGELWSKQTAWLVNVVGTKNIIDAAKKHNKKVLYMSTDFVFDGEKDVYTEEDTPNPQNWYATTKHEGEKLVSAYPSGVIIRIAFPFRARFDKKLDFVRAIVQQLESGKTVLAPSDNVFTPTYIDDVANAVKTLMENVVTGIYHANGNTVLSSFDAAKLIAKVFDLDPSLVQKTTFSDYYRNRAKRPCKLALRNDKITALGTQMKTFLEGLQEVQKQKSENGYMV